MSVARVPVADVVPDSALCAFLQRIVGIYKSADYAETMGNVYDAYVNYSKCYEMLNAFISLAPAKAQLIPPAKCIQSCGKESQTCNIKFFLALVSERLKTLGDKMAPSVEKLVLDVRGTGSANEPDEEFACQSLKLPQGQDRLCDTWFNDIIGLRDAKDRLQEGFIYPLLYPNLYGAVSGGVLLYGPPGTGKTMLARALINEMEDRSRNPTSGTKCSRFLYFAPTTDMLKGKYVGETEKKITQLFMGASKLACKVAEKQQLNVISVIFIDEVDGLAPSRDAEGAQAQIISSAVNTLLQMMDGVNAPKNVVVLAATNYPDSLDSAFRRRFQYQIPIDLPSQTDIEDQINLLISKHVTKYDDYAASRARMASICRTGVSASTNCVEMAQNSQGCSRPDPKDIVDSREWKKDKYHIKGLLRDSIIKVFAKKLFEQHYSGSDVARLFNSVVKLSATAALRSGVFYHVDGRYVSANCFKTVPPPAGAEMRMMVERVTDTIASMIVGSTVYYNRIDYTRKIYPLPDAADELYVNEHDKYAEFVIRYDFTVPALSGHTFSMFMQTKPIAIEEGSKFLRWLRGNYSPEQLDKSLETGVITADPLILTGLFFVRDMSAQTLTYAEFVMDTLWLPNTVLDVISQKQLIMTPQDDMAESEQVLRAMMKDVANKKFTTAAGIVNGLEAHYDNFFFTSYKQKAEKKENVSCADWLRSNTEYVNWDMNERYFTRARAMGKSTIDANPKTLEQYNTFKNYLTTLQK